MPEFTPLLENEGRVGTYGELLKIGRRGDNLTPHHIPADAYMKVTVSNSKLRIRGVE